MRLLHRVVKSSEYVPAEDTVFINNKIKSERAAREKAQGADGAALEQVLSEESADMDTIIEQRTAKAVKEQMDRLKTDINNQRIKVLKIAQDGVNDLYEQANAKASVILSVANEDAIKIKELARQDGHREGYETGYKDAMEKCDSYLKVAAKFIAEINARKEAYFVSVEDELFETCMEMTRKMVLAELKTDKNVLLRIAKEAARDFKNDDRIKISFAEGAVSEEIISDAEFVKAAVGASGDAEIEILPKAPEGTVIVDNGSEIVDASVPTQLDFLREVMENSRNK